MNILLSLSIVSLTFLSPHNLLAKDANNQVENNRLENRLEEAEKLGCDSAPISNLPSSISYLGVTPKLMMNPSTLEEGAEAIGEALGVLGKRAVSAKGPAVEVASISSNSSNQVLRLRGGGPKKSQPTGGLKSTGDTSEEEDDDASDADSSASEDNSADINDVLNTHIQDAIETEGRAHVASNLLEKSLQAKKEFKKQRALASGRADVETRSVSSVDSTWIQNTLYKTAQMKLGATLKKEQIDLQNNGSHSPSSEDQGLAAKEKMASLRLKQAGLALTKAQRAEETAKTRLITEEGTHKEILADSFATPLDQENSSLNIIYQRALVTYATSDHELKKLMRDLAEAKLGTVNAELMVQEAQHIEGDLSFLNEAETGLEVAKEAEEAVEAVTDPVANEAASRNSWCEALKRAFETTIATNTLRKKLQSSVSLSSPSLRQIGSDIIQETQATEQAWGEVVDICNSALDKKLDLRLKNAWEKDLEEAVNQHALWQVRVLWSKTRKTAESSKSSNISQDTALQQAKEINSVYDEMVATVQKKQNETPARLKSWWNNDLQQIEVQRTTHQAELAKLKEAEVRIKAEAAAKAKAEAQAAKELSDAIEIAGVAWDQAVELAHQADAAKVSADRIKTENAYQGMNRFAQNTSAAWAKAEEMKRVVLYKTTDVNQKTSLNDKIQAAINNKVQYDRLATEALANIQEVVKRAEEMKAQAEADKRIAAEKVRMEEIRHQEEAKAAREREAAMQLAQERVAWLEIQKKIKPEVIRKMGEIREKIALIEEQIEKATETYRLAWERVERVNNKWMVKSSTRTEAKETAERSTADLERVKVEKGIAEADLARCQELLTRLEQGPQEKAKKSQEARLKAQTAVGDSLSCWKEVIESLEKSAEYWKKASEIQTTLAVDYSLAAIESEQAAEYSRKGAEAYTKVIGQDKKWREGNRWKEAGKSAQYSADCRIQGVEAQRLGKQANVQEYAAAAEKLQQATTLFTQAVQLLLEGNEKEQDILWKQGNSLQLEGICKKYRLQGVEAQEVGKTTLAAAYHEAAAISQRAADQWKLYVQTFAAGKESEAISWQKEGSSLQSKADYCAKAAEAQEAGKATLVGGYGEAAATSQRAADQHKLSAQTFAAGKVNEAISWQKEGISLQSKADYQAKAAEAQEAGKATLSGGYGEAAATSQRAADQHKLSAQTFAAEKVREAISWQWEGSSLQSKADYGAKAAEAQECGKTTLAAAYREAAATSQRAADQYKLAAQTKAAGKESEGESWSWEGSSLQSKADYCAKAAEAQECGKTTLAAAYREAAAISQQVVDQHKLAAQTKAEGRDSEGKSWSNGGVSLQSKADYCAKVAEAQESGKITLAAAYREAAAISQRAADQHKLAAKTKAAGKENEGISWSWEGLSLEAKADYCAKAAEAQESGKITLATGYREAAATSQRAADQLKLSAQTFASGKVNDAISWLWEGLSLQAKAGYQAKANEAQEAGNATLVAGYREAAAISQRAAEQWQLAAQAHAAEKVAVGNSWQLAGKNFQLQADYQVKAYEAQEVKKTVLAAGYRDASSIFQRTADQYGRAAQVYATGNINEGNNWYVKGKASQEEAETIAKRAEERQE